MLRSIFRQAPAAPKTDAVATINAQALKARLDQDDKVLLLDVRTPHEFQFDGHVAGARLIPLAALASRVNELPKDRPIVCICRSGARSQSAAEWLVRAGHTEVFNLTGGMIGWRMAGLPVG